MMTSSSAPYIFACQVPQPSLKRGGTTEDNGAPSFGLRKRETWTRGPWARRRGRRARTGESGPGRVARL